MREKQPYISVAPAKPRSTFEDKWARERSNPFPARLSHLMWNTFEIDGACAPKPDKGFVKSLQKINPGLSVHWIGKWNKWGIFLDKRSLGLIVFDDKKIIEFGYFPILIEVIQTKDSKYAPLSYSNLPFLDMNKYDMHKFFMRLRQAEYDTKEKAIENQKKIIQYGKKDRIKLLRTVLRDRIGDVPDITIPISGLKN